jgi:hypothetical protein
MNKNGEKVGYKVYSGVAYRDIRHLREGRGENMNSYKKQRAVTANHELMKEFRQLKFEIPRGVPRGIRYVYRGQSLNSFSSVSHKGVSYLCNVNRTYVSFSTSIEEAYKFSIKSYVDNPVILKFDIKSMGAKNPVLYDKLWGFRSYNPTELEVLMLPGKFYIDTLECDSVKIYDHSKKVPIRKVAHYIPDKSVRNMKTGSINPYSKV